MAFLENFNADEHEPLNDFSPIPKGEYVAMLTDSDLNDTKDGTGKVLKVVFDVLEGEYKDRKVFEYLNLENKNPTAAKIGNSALADICRSVGVPRPKDSAELHNKPMVIKVDIEERRDDPGKFKNRIKAYKNVSQKTESIKSFSQQDNVPPWKKK